MILGIVNEAAGHTHFVEDFRGSQLLHYTWQVGLSALVRLLSIDTIHIIDRNSQRILSDAQLSGVNRFGHAQALLNKVNGIRIT